jgi:hypothetical protein
MTKLAVVYKICGSSAVKMSMLVIWVVRRIGLKKMAPSGEHNISAPFPLTSFAISTVCMLSDHSSKYLHNNNNNKILRCFTSPCEAFFCFFMLLVAY